MPHTFQFQPHPLIVIVVGTILLVSLTVGIVSFRRGRLTARRLRDSEEKCRIWSEESHDVAWMADLNGNFLYQSPSVLKLRGYSPEEACSLSMEETFAGESLRAAREALARLVEGGGSRDVAGLELEVTCKGGGTVLSEVSARLMFDEGGRPTHIVGLMRDLTERRAMEARVRRITNIYAALNHCSEAIKHKNSEDALFPVVCRYAVRYGGMKLAWVGLVNPETKMVVPVAWNGEGDSEEYLRDIQVSVDERSPFGGGPIGICLRENRPFWCQDFRDDPATEPWRAHGERFGWGSSSALPINRNGKPVGVLALYAEEVDAFDDTERHFLEEMAMNISFALDRFQADRIRAELQGEIIATKNRMESILASITQVVWSQDAKTRQMLYLNPAAENVYGRSVDDFYRDPGLWLSVVHPADRPIIEEMMRRLYEQGSAQAEFRIVRPDDEVRWVHEEAHLIWDERHAPLRLDGILSDISDRKRSEEALRLNASVYDNAGEGIAITDADRNIVSVNAAFTEVTGYALEEVRGKNPSILNSGRQDAAFYQAMWNAINTTGRWRGEICNRKKNGELYTEMLTINAVKNDRGEVVNYLGIFSDITDLKRTQEKLKNLADYDLLTKLPNRSLLADRLHQILAQAKRTGSLLVVCFMDLDDFKPINDRYGHEMGDKLLIEVARRISSIVRAGDTVARWGGDEFVILLTSVPSMEGIEPSVIRILNEVSAAYVIDQRELRISASIGITVYPMDNSDSEALLRHADSAMYQAKQAGRNRFHLFDAQMNQQIQARHQKQERLRTALRNNELCLYYQSKVNLQTSEFIGMEALLRWRHPEKGLLSPLDFLPQIESTSLIVDIGDWVIDTALSQISEWMRMGREIPISVNVAGRQLQQPDFTDKLDASLARYPGVPSYLLELEILETSALEIVQCAKTVMKSCKRLGVSFALDDFGTGYSSLAYLKQLPAKTLKIDRTFVRDMLEDKEDQAIVSGVIQLAKVFRRKVIAEGVETRQHALKLMEMGCELAQGYGIAYPMPADAVMGWIRDYETTHTVKG